jgi:uncharacterized protein YebE (UPF0316 family)
MEIFSGSLGWLALPVLIFFARVADVTLGTLRIIFLSRGRRVLAPVLGFFEVLIWIIAVGQLVQNLDNWASYIAYAAGFAVGNYLGLTVEHRMAIGMLTIRIIGGVKEMDRLAEYLRESGYGVTEVNGEGSHGEVKLLFTIIQRKALEKVVDLIHDINPKVFFSVESVQAAREGVFPTSRSRQRWNLMGLIGKRF